jgi:predicted porin
VAGAVLALSASANAGIIIPAGDWTLDINGNVNSYVTQTSIDSADAITGTVHQPANDRAKRSIGTGLLPAWIGFTGKTRQNDLDIEFTISLQPGSSDNSVHGDGSLKGLGEGATGSNAGSSVLNRQTYVSFGDKSWGTIKLGKDLGIYGADAILNDMTLLGVGGFHSAGNGLSGASINTTTGGIGSGYQYAAWRGQVAYTTPNWNGFQATVGLMNPNQVGPGAFNEIEQGRYGYEGKASYAWTGDVSGKVWASGASYSLKHAANQKDDSISAYDIGATVNVDKFGLTGYVYDGSGNGAATLGLHGVDAAGQKRDGNGGYVQATYIIPTKTKLGIAYGETNLDRARGETVANLMDKTERITVGAYHPLTKHLNLVAEYNDYKIDAHNNPAEIEFNSVSLGAILFF